MLMPGVALLAQRQAAVDTVGRIRARHVLACGVVSEDAEYSMDEDHSSRGGFDEALCQAYAMAADARASVKVTSFLDELSAEQALRVGKVDVVATLSADALHRAKGVRYARPIFYDALGLLTPLAAGVHTPRDLAGKKICVLAETGTEEALRAWFRERRVDYLPFPFQEEGEMEAAYVTGNCEALAAERTRLAQIRLSMGEGAALHAILPEPLSREAMASGTASGDARWAGVVDAVDRVLLLADEPGVGWQAGEFRERTDRMGAALGLRAGWAVDVVAAVGSYGQMFYRTLGSTLPQDLNRLQRDGGLLRNTPQR